MRTCMSPRPYRHALPGSDYLPSMWTSRNARQATTVRPRQVRPILFRSRSEHARSSAPEPSSTGHAHHRRSGHNGRTGSRRTTLRMKPRSSLHKHRSCGFLPRLSEPEDGRAQVRPRPRRHPVRRRPRSLREPTAHRYGVGRTRPPCTHPVRWGLSRGLRRPSSLRERH